MNRLFQKGTALFLAVLLLFSSSGCAKRAADREENFSIVASFYPMYIMLLNITDGVEGVQVHVMAQQHTGCLHDYQLQNSDMQELTQADVFVINGAGMESFLDRVTAQLPNLPVITASEGIPLLAEDALVIVEHEFRTLPVVSEAYERTDTRKYGYVGVSFYRMRE